MPLHNYANQPQAVTYFPTNSNYNYNYMPYNPYNFLCLTNSFFQNNNYNTNTNSNFTNYNTSNNRNW